MLVFISYYLCFFICLMNTLHFGYLVLITQISKKKALYPCCVAFTHSFIHLNVYFLFLLCSGTFLSKFNIQRLIFKGCALRRLHVLATYVRACLASDKLSIIQLIVSWGVNYCDFFLWNIMVTFLSWGNTKDMIGWQMWPLEGAAFEKRHSNSMIIAFVVILSK